MFQLIIGKEIYKISYLVMNKFIYFFSPIYKFYDKHINENLNNYFNIESILINDIINNGDYDHAFFGGTTIKIELIINKIEENLNNYIIFSDATIFINSKNASKLDNFINQYKNNDLCFAYNGKGRHNYGHDYNIGFILIHCNNKTLSFFKQVLIDLINNKGWDQNVINQKLKNNHDLTVDVFDPTKICCGYEFNIEYLDKYLIYKSFIHHTKNINNNFNQRLLIFKNYKFITDDEYNNYKK